MSPCCPPRFLLPWNRSELSRGGSVVFSAKLQNLLAFWSEIINAVGVSRTPLSGRKVCRKEGPEKVSETRGCAWVWLCSCVHLRTIPNCFHLDRWDWCNEPLCDVLGFPSCQHGLYLGTGCCYTRTICVGTLMWLRLHGFIPHRHAAELAKVSFITASGFALAGAHQSCPYAL